MDAGPHSLAEYRTAEIGTVGSGRPHPGVPTRPCTYTHVAQHAAPTRACRDIHSYRTARGAPTRACRDRHTCTYHRAARARVTPRTAQHRQPRRPEPPGRVSGYARRRVPHRFARDSLHRPSDTACLAPALTSAFANVSRRRIPVRASAVASSRAQLVSLHNRKFCLAPIYGRCMPQSPHRAWWEGEVAR